MQSSEGSPALSPERPERRADGDHNGDDEKQADAGRIPISVAVAGAALITRRAFRRGGNDASDQAPLLSLIFCPASLTACPVLCAASAVFSAAASAPSLAFSPAFFAASLAAWPAFSIFSL